MPKGLSFNTFKADAPVLIPVRETLEFLGYQLVSPLVEFSQHPLSVSWFCKVAGKQKEEVLVRLIRVSQHYLFFKIQAAIVHQRMRCFTGILTTLT